MRYPEALKSLNKMLDGAPTVRVSDVISSTIHSTQLLLPTSGPRAGEAAMCWLALSARPFGRFITSQIQVGSILIDDRPMITRALAMEIEPYLGNWSLVRFPEGRALDRKARSAGWGFFFMAAEVRAGSLGAAAANNIRKALMRILAIKPAQSFNCLEVTGIETKHFVAIAYTIVAPHWRHIQPGSVCTVSGSGKRNSEKRNAPRVEKIDGMSVWERANCWRFPMYRPDEFLAIIVGLMFLCGVVLIVHSVRQRSRTGKQWSRVPGQAEERIQRPAKVDHLYF